MNAFLQKLEKWKINEKRSSIHGTLMNRQLLQFVASVSRKIARYPTRRVSSIFNTGDVNPLLFLFASFNYLHVKLAWFHSGTGCSLSLSFFLSFYVSPPGQALPASKFNEKPRYTFHSGMPRAYGLRHREIS